jgi:hypothetical protein
MQLACEHHDIDAAIAELKAALPLDSFEREIGAVALASIIERRAQLHRPRRALRRQLSRLRAGQLMFEVAA